jgi:ATP-dependent DNA helicase RecG
VFSDERIFSGPLVLTAVQAVSAIRNWSAEIGGESPRTVSAYRIASLEEAVLNAFAHQDYSLRGTVDITERDGESVSVRSRGTFFGDPESFASGRSVPAPARNRFLREAMAKSGMAAGKGTGIRGMYLSQAHRHFPLPSYSIDDDYVSVTFHGIRYGDLPRIMDSSSGLDIGTLIDLDRICSGRLVPGRRMKSLIERGLADTEGGIARAMPGGSRVVSDRDAVLELMASGPVSRSDVAAMLRSRASRSLTAEQIGVKATNLLQSMRKEGLIVKVGGSTKSAAYWLPEGRQGGHRPDARLALSHFIR